MKSTPEAVDRGPVLGPAIKPAAPAQPDPVKDFATKRHDLIGNESKAIETVVDTLKKGGAPVPVIDDDPPIIFLGSDYIEAMRLLDGEESL